MAAVQPDIHLVREQLEALQIQLKTWGAKLFCASMFWILAKKELITNTLDVDTQPEGKVLIPFNYNRAQEDLESNLARHNLLLKTRQEGGTTYFALRRLFLPAITRAGTGCLQISQSNEYVEKHFRMIRRAHRFIGCEDPMDRTRNVLNISLRQHLLHTAYSNRRELVFDQLESTIMVATAEVEESGQGVTLHHVLADEYARWPGNPESTLSNVRGALVPEGTVDKISTGNGQVGPFYEDCLRAMDHPELSDAKFHFHPWWWGEEYQLPLTEDEKDLLIGQLTEEEHSVIKIIHQDLRQVAWTKEKLEGAALKFFMPRIAWRRQAKLEQRGNFDEKYPEDPITAFLAMGKMYFDQQILIARKRELVGYKPFQTLSNGDAKLFNARIPGRRYVIGADPAQGRLTASEDVDYCAGVVLDLETAEEMAAYRARVTPQDFAYDLADLGRYYNDAWIAVERTAEGGTTILTLAGECKYPGVMKFKEWWKRDRKKLIEIEGFPTTLKTRPVALNFLNAAVLRHPELIWDEQFINEALVFVRDEKGIPKASPQAHDDTVACRWIAHAARMYLLGYWVPGDTRKEDYVSADRLTGTAAAGWSYA